MQNEQLMALLLDPFLTFEEVVKEVGATPAIRRDPSLTLSGPTAPRSTARPARVNVRSVPVVHHLPTTAG